MGESSAAAGKDIFSRGDLASGQGLWAVTKLGGSGAVAVQQIQSLTMPLYGSSTKRSP
jgi:hypothetical protein